jgi:ankyrin repeat protein
VCAAQAGWEMPKRDGTPTEAEILRDAIYDGKLTKVKRMVDKAPALLDSRTDSQLKTPFIHAATWGHVHIMRELKDKYYADHRALTKDGDTALHYAAWGGHEESVNYCLDLGLSVTHLSNTLMDPMMTAAMQGK